MARLGKQHTQDGFVFAPPPGLELPSKKSLLAQNIVTDMIAPPPGLFPSHEGHTVSPPARSKHPLNTSTFQTFTVSISGLPAKLLNNMLIEAVLEQMGSDAAPSSFTIHNGVVNVVFDDEVKSQRCVRHFDGCNWGGKRLVKARLTQSPIAPLWAPKRIEMTSVWGDCVSSHHSEPKALLALSEKFATRSSATSEASTECEESASDVDSENKHHV